MMRTAMLRHALIVAALIGSILATALPASAGALSPSLCLIGAPAQTCGGPNHR